ncbi:MAG TPA: efflux RND transporter periplasmic adaptor subunit [Polyangiales bacterium]|nr:efflux RND transporter periplasmic adaptor subunit [Polyangiales bacterium]
MPSASTYAVLFGALWLGTTLATACADAAQARAPRQPAPGNANPARRPPLLLSSPLDAASSEQYLGVLLPEQASDVIAPQSGLIEGMHAALGEIVNAGQLLVSLSMQQAALEHERAVAERDAARAVLGRSRIEQAHAQAESERHQSLAGEGLVTREQLAQARFHQSETRARAIEAESRLAERNARVQQLLALRDQTRVTASFRGRVAVRYVSAGARVEAGTPLLRLISDGTVVLRFAIAEQESAVQVGSTVELMPVEHPELSYQATVQRISPEIDAASRMRTVEATPSQADAAQLTASGLLGAIVQVKLSQPEAP